MGCGHCGWQWTHIWLSHPQSTENYPVLGVQRPRDTVPTDAGWVQVTKWQSTPQWLLDGLNSPESSAILYVYIYIIYIYDIYICFTVFHDRISVDFSGWKLRIWRPSRWPVTWRVKAWTASCSTSRYLGRWIYGRCSWDMLGLWHFPCFAVFCWTYS